MKIIVLNTKILDALTRCGFRYCYSKTVIDEKQTAVVAIYLTPVYVRPNIRRLPFRYDTYFNLSKEPRQMAMGIDESTAVYVNLEDTLLKDVL